jgi:hypothetical protein
MNLNRYNKHKQNMQCFAEEEANRQKTTTQYRQKIIELVRQTGGQNTPRRIGDTYDASLAWVCCCCCHHMASSVVATDQATFGRRWRYAMIFRLFATNRMLHM